MGKLLAGEHRRCVLALSHGARASLTMSQSREHLERTPGAIVDRYFCSMSRFVRFLAPALLALARGRRDWVEFLRDGSVTAAGDPDLVSHLTEWFRPRSAPDTASLAGG